MISSVDLINFATAVGGVIISLLCLFLTLSVQYLTKRDQRFFMVFFSLLFLYVTSDLISQISLVFWKDGLWQLSKAAVFSESLFSSLLMPMFTIYILSSAGENYKKSPAYYTVFAVWAIYFVLLIFTQFSDAIYYFTQDNIYHRGALYPILLIPPALLMLINLILLFKKRNKLTPGLQIAIAIYLIVPLICTIIQMIAYGLLMIVIGTSVAALVMFIFILIDQVDLYVRQREQILAQKSSISVLQMRPHFISNTLTSIYYLCEQDPKKAQQVTYDFMTYLRDNFTAIAKEGDIPFKDELEHAKAYLAVEQVRFEGLLYVEFDTPHTYFRVPPLTLQPLVENAVRHGLSPDLDPLHISIITRKTDKGSELIVEDTGIGFTAIDHTTPHIALENIRERIETFCGGTLTIESKNQGGTVVTIFIPDKKQPR